MSGTEEKLSRQQKLFAAGMWILWDFESDAKRYDKFLKRGRPFFKSLIEGVLLHDQIVIPTQDFMILTALLGILGECAVLDMLEMDCLRFLRINGFFGYQGAKGIQTYEIHKPDGQKLPVFASAETAVDWAIGSRKEKPKSPKLSGIVLEKTEEVKLNSIVYKIRHETYMDVLNSQYLRDFFALRNRHMDRLAGVGPNQVRIYGGTDGISWKADEVGIVMALAQTNLELYLAQTLDCADLSTGSPVGHLIKGKVERTCTGQYALEAFAILKEIADIPDIGETVLQKSISLKKLLKLRQSSDGKQFRKWFHENCCDNPVATAKEYTSLLRDVKKIQSLPIRILRFIVTGVLGTLCGPIGLGVGVADSFFIDKLLKGGSPKFFIENIRQLQGKPRWFRR